MGQLSIAIMRPNNFIFVALAAMLLWLPACQSPESEPEASISEKPAEEMEVPAYAIVIHGGAGTIRKSDLRPEQEEAIRSALSQALDIGEAILQEGGSALDAVEQTIRSLEDAPYFNAGRGAVFTNEGKNELDASIMVGTDRAAGAVGGVTNVKHPISAARAVMEQSPHVLLTGRGAEVFAEEKGLEIVDPQYFFTQFRYDALQEARRAEANQQQSYGYDPTGNDSKFGTVGCVALDANGTIVAGTSTGGMTNKRYNRIGDSPIIGAGTFASNATAGVSCTGHGEFFIRYAVAYDVHALMAYSGMSLEEATNEIIHNKLKAVGGSGGLIALDHKGNVAMPFNSEGMYRGYARPGERFIDFYKN